MKNNGKGNAWHTKSYGGIAIVLANEETGVFYYWLGTPDKELFWEAVPPYPEQQRHP